VRVWAHAATLASERFEAGPDQRQQPRVCPNAPARLHQEAPAYVSARPGPRQGLMKELEMMAREAVLTVSTALDLVASAGAPRSLGQRHVARVVQTQVLYCPPFLLDLVQHPGNCTALALVRLHGPIACDLDRQVCHQRAVCHCPRISLVSGNGAGFR